MPLFGMAEDSGDSYILAYGGHFSTTRRESGRRNGSLGLAYRRLGGTYGITLVVDMLAAALLLSAVLAATVAVYACGRSLPIWICSVDAYYDGVNGAFVAGDVFNPTFGLVECVVCSLSIGRRTKADGRFGKVCDARASTLQLCFWRGLVFYTEWQARLIWRS